MLNVAPDCIWGYPLPLNPSPGRRSCPAVSTKNKNKRAIHGVADLIPVHPFTPTGSFYRTTIECPIKAVYQCDVTI